MSCLPTPQGWKSQRRLLASTVVIAGLGGAYFDVKTVLAVETNHWMASAITAAAAVVLLIAAVSSMLFLMGWGRLRATFDESGTTLLCAAVVRWLAVWFGAVTIGDLLYLVFGSQARDDLSEDFRVRSIGWLLIALAGSFGGLFLAFRASCRGRPVLRISLGGIDFRDAVTQFAIGWDEIGDITGVRDPKSKNAPPVVLERTDQAPAEVIASASLYAPGGVALFWMLRHYWRHADERAELINGVAVERLKSERFPAE